MITSLSDPTPRSSGTLPTTTRAGSKRTVITTEAPKAAANDLSLYDRLALIDMLRGGRLRERSFSEMKLKEMLA